MIDPVVNALLRAPDGVASRFRIAFLRALGARIGPKCRIVAPQVPKNPWDIRLGAGVALDRNVILLAFGPRLDTPRISIHDGCYINRGTMIDASLSISVGAGTMIGPYVYITDHDHGSPDAGRLADAPLVEAPVTISSNVWIGAGSVILKGVTVGAGAVIGAGSVVTKNVPPGARMVGVPAVSILSSSYQRSGL